MAAPINPLRAAQIISYAKGQENQRAQSSEKREQERLEEQEAQLARQVQSRNKTTDTQKGILA